MLVGILTGAAVVAARGQGVLSEFTYDNLRFSGIQADVGSLAGNDLRGALVGGVRIDAGYLAPHVRLLLGLSYARSQFSERAVARFNQSLLALVNDPDGNATIDIGRVRLADLMADLDVQYVFNEGRSVTVALGVGAGVHLRDGSGRAINGTFIEDALDGVAPALNGTVGLSVALSPAWRILGELRGTLLSDYSTASARVGFGYRLPAGRAGR